jgi:voltage-gated potassium channel Kch
MKKNFLIVDFNPDIIHKLMKDKIHCIYGDISDDEIIERVNLEKAKIVISTIPDPENTMFLILKTRKVNKDCTLIVTSYTVDEALELYKNGADYVIMPHLLGGRHASLILEEFHKDFKSLVKTKVQHIEELNKQIHTVKNGRKS